MKASSIIAGFVLAAAAAGLGWYLMHPGAKPGNAAAGPPPAVPVTAVAVEARDVPVYVTGLGTVQAYNSVTVHVRVDGQLDKVAFTEGQDVRQGDLLAQIDPRPFQAALDQALAKQASDQAQLANAKLDLERFSNLASRQFASRQSVDTQKSAVAQLEAALRGDQAAIDNARVQLSYATITAPISGRTGIRMIDQGNIVHASDQTGLVVITQLQPISLIFTLSQDRLPETRRGMSGGPLEVIAYDRSDTTRLAEGTLALVDNQVDPASGMIRLKATFPNADRALWPGQFVNARLTVAVHKDGLTVPAPVVQRGPQGTFAYLIKPDRTVEARPIKVTQIQDGVALIAEGLAAGDQVVADGQYKLKPGSRVKATLAEPARLAAGEAGAS
ncbi:MAG: efflux RND transporter periplasmic adaptor subunit [Dongiaceae bacterium]